MHIALADSSPGDRKQMERLLSRESDKRINTTGNFYINTFGSSQALLNTPTVYDVYFLDVTEEEGNAYDIAALLRKKGIMSPIVFCVSSIDYRTIGEELPNSLYIDKPIKVSQLSDLLDNLISEGIKNRVPTVEFRDNYESFYIEESRIVYIKGNDYTVTVHLTDGTERVANGMIDNLWRNVKAGGTFVPLNGKTIANKSHISKVSLMNCILSDGSKHVINPAYMSKYKIKSNH